MASWQKKAFWVAGISSVLLLSFMVALPALLNAEKIKSLAHEKAQQSWSRELSIGNLSLRLRPFPELHAENVVLANPSWAKNKNMLQASSVAAHLELLPLLMSRTVRVKSLSAEGVVIHLEVSPKGIKSWDLNTHAETKKPTMNREPDHGFLHLNSVRIRNADISYQNSGNEISAWRLDEINGKARAGLLDVRIDARLARNKHPVHVEAKFDDLSRLGEKGAVSKGFIDMRWDSSQLKMAGKFPLEASLQGHELQANFASKSLEDILGFFGIEGRGTAPFKLDTTLIESQGKITATDLKIGLGKLIVTGEAQLALSGPKPVINARLAADHMDWAQTLKDAGNPPHAPKPEDEFFDVHPLGWKVLLALQVIEGSIDTQVAKLKLRSGVELKNAKARMNLKGDQFNMSAFSASLLGGSMSGNMQLNADKKSVRLNLDATDFSLAQWFAERGRKVAFTGGPMKIKASVSASGSSMKDLAASLTGPVSIRMGPGIILSQKAGETESLLIGTFAGSEADRISLQCVGAQLPFSKGRAAAQPLVGARSDTSYLLTAGLIDLREQILDLRGRVKAASGVSLGVSAVTGDVRIAGKLGQIEFGLDPAGAPEALARIGAAIATGGASILGTAIWDAANTKGDPCAIVAAAKEPSEPKKPAR